MAGPNRAAQPVGQGAGRYGGGESVRVHLFRTRRIEQVDAGLGDKRCVGRLVARIGVEILVGPELGGIDEQADHHPVGRRAGRRHQRAMALVQRPHGRHQGDALAGGAPSGDLGAQLGHRAHHRDGAVGPLLGHWAPWASAGDQLGPALGAEAMLVAGEAARAHVVGEGACGLLDLGAEIGVAFDEARRELGK